MSTWSRGIETFRQEESLVITKLEQQAADRSRTLRQLLDILNATVPEFVVVRRDGLVPLEPRPREAEIEFIWETASQYPAKPLRRPDILSCWAGIRPLVKTSGAGSTAALARDHVIRREPSGMITITGGKWTT